MRTDAMIDFLKSEMWIRPRIGGVACWSCERLIFDAPLVHLTGCYSSGVASCDRDRCRRVASAEAHKRAVAFLVEWRGVVA